MDPLVRSQMPRDCGARAALRRHSDASPRVSPALRAASLLDPGSGCYRGRDVVILRLCRSLLLDPAEQCNTESGVPLPVPPVFWDVLVVVLESSVHSTVFSFCGGTLNFDECWRPVATAIHSTLSEIKFSTSDSLLYELERDDVAKSPILLEISQKLPVHTRTATGAIRFCHHCQLIKPDRCHHCSVCQTCVLKMDHHCLWLNNCMGFSNYKFFMLFLLYSLLYCLLIVSTVTPTVIQLWRGRLFDSCVKLHVLFLTLVSAIFAITLCFLLIFHIWLLTSNKTTLEWLSVPFFANGPGSKAFDVGVQANFLQVFGKKKRLWLFPVFSSEGDGHSFPLSCQMSSHGPPVMNGHERCATLRTVASPKEAAVTIAVD